MRNHAGDCLTLLFGLEYEFIYRGKKFVRIAGIKPASNSGGTKLGHRGVICSSAGARTENFPGRISAANNSNWPRGLALNRERNSVARLKTNLDRIAALVATGGARFVHLLRGFRAVRE